MAPTTNKRVLFAEIPQGYPVPGKTTVYDASETIDVENVPLNGGFLLKTLVLSIDPYMRGRMRSADKPSYATAFKLGAPLQGHGIGVVVRSENAEVSVGQYIHGTEIPHQEYSILSDFKELTVLQKDPTLPWTVFVGAAGMPGKTAYMGWKEFSHAKKDLMVIQLAKRDGLKVIASAGSEEKLQFMKEIGADVVFNYKTTNTREVLAREGPINVYWDNVGGESLDAALEYATIYTRIIELILLVGYNTAGYEGIKNMNYVFEKSLTISGLLVFRLLSKYDQEFYATIPRALAAGEIKYKEEVTKGLETVGDAILRVQEGKNHGKAVVVVAEE
ncbi:chaperonin 10-like protein [Mycena epipterygia]|nr:chaperonin 10-like protein [Mycena epipterygia]